MANENPGGHPGPDMINQVNDTSSDGLFDHHRRELLVESAIDPEVVRERGYRTIARPTGTDPRPREELKALGIPSWAIAEDYYFAGLLIPMYRATGERASYQWKPRQPVPNRDGKRMKYASVKGQSAVIDVHPRWTYDRGKDDPALVPAIRDISIPLWITEGVKKADSMTSRGLCTVALAGVYNWRSTMGTLGDWEDVPLRGRNVGICFDADATANPMVLDAMRRLGRWLKSKGAANIWYLITPGEVNGTRVKGVDDFFAAGGTLTTLYEAATPTCPSSTSTDGTFSDAMLAEVVATDVLEGQFCWVKGLDWLSWDGRKWAEASQAAVTEAVRQYALGRFQQIAGQIAVAANAKAAQALDAQLSEWRKTLSAGRLGALIGLSRGIVERRVEEFDADPDLLNTPAGIVDLRTGTVSPHDPDRLMTKITSGSYRPGHTHADWDKALEALPKEVAEWVQVRFGQAITGHPTPDGIMPIFQGGGENGKGAMTTDGLVPALAGYASMASPKLFMSTKGTEHSTEMADLRGRRLLIAEEIAEGRSIDVTALKRIQDVGRIKARFVHRDNMEFDTTHSLFSTSNYIPIVSETDHGTWRRLALVRFPYTFLPPGRPLESNDDRRGDPNLKGRIKANKSGQHDAIVTWAVEGAIRWYADCERIETEAREGIDPHASIMLPPPTVADDTRAWRAEADRILGFWPEHLVPDPNRGIPTKDMLAAFNAWLDSNGHQGWAKETFGPRFENHSETLRAKVKRKRVRGPEGLDRYERSGGSWVSYAAENPLPAQPEAWWGVRFRTESDQG